MTFKLIVFLIMLICFGSVQSVYAYDFSFINKLFQQQQYQQVLNTLKRLKAGRSDLAEKYYFKGLCESRLQETELAIKSFAKAIKFKSIRPDIYYEYGQVLYANNDLEKARKYFTRSYKKKIKESVSLYYVAFISQTLEEYKRAKKAYLAMLKIKKADRKFQQIAHFQLAEVMLSLVENKSDPRRIVKKYIIPRLKIAWGVDPQSPVAVDIVKKKQEVEKRYGLDPRFMVNGNRAPHKRYRFQGSQKIVYDNNITLSSNQPLVQATQKDSYVYTTKVDGSVNYVFKQRFILAPSLRVTHTYHDDRKTASVYKNDRYTIDPRLRTKTEHSLGKTAGTLLFNIDYNYTAQDRMEKHSKIYYSRAITYTLGEKVKFFKAGATTLKLQFKPAKSYDKNNDSESKMLTIDQIVTKLNGHLMLFFYQNNQLRYPQTTSLDTDMHIFRVDYIVPVFVPKIMLHVGFMVTLLKPLDETEYKSRGTETTYDPSLAITKNVGKGLKLSFSYNYSKKDSLQKSNLYSKHVSGLELKYIF